MNADGRDEWRMRYETGLAEHGMAVAAGIAREWLGACPDDWEPCMILGTFHLGRDQARLAQDYLCRAVAAAPEHAEAWLALGEAQRMLSDADAAIESVRKAGACAPESQKARARLFQLLEQSGRKEEAQEVGAEWLQDFPDSTWARRTVHGQATTALTLRSVLARLRRGEVDEAEQDLSHIIERRNGTVRRDVLRSVVQAFRTRRRLPAAARCCALWLRSAPHDIEFLALQGNLSLRLGNLGDAKTTLEQALLLSPDAGEQIWLDYSLALLQQDEVSRGRKVLVEGIGQQEEQQAHAALFGLSAAHVPYLGAAIEDCLAAPARTPARHECQ